VSDSGIPRVRRGAQLQYESSVFSPIPETQHKHGPKMVPCAIKSELKDVWRSPRLADDRMDDGKSVDTDMKRRKHVLAGYDTVKQAVQKLDTGSITARDLKSALDRLGIKMRSSDFRRLAGDVVFPDSHQHTTHLPSLGRHAEMPARRREGGLPQGKHATQKHVRKTKPMMQHEPHASPGAWRSMLETKVSRHWKQLQKEFKSLDTQRIGLVDMHNLIAALEVYGIVLQTQDADALYLQMGVGPLGKIHYGEFLKCFAGAGLSRKGAISAPPDLMMNSLSKRASYSIKHGTSQLDVPSDIEGYMRSAASHWRAIRQACCILDKPLTKSLRKEQFKSVLHKLGVSAPERVLDTVCQRYRATPAHLVEGCVRGARGGDNASDYYGGAEDSFVRKPCGGGGVGGFGGGGGRRDEDKVEYNRFIKDLARLFPSAF
jgi:hypothetical protein